MMMKMNNKLNKLFMNKIQKCVFPTLIILLIFIVFSCKKDPTTVGLEIQSKSSEMILNYDDSTVTLSAVTVKRDSMNTTNVSTFVLGYLNDPSFGITNAAFNTNFRLETTSPNFGINPVADSICLYLKYAGSWGDSTTEFVVNVYRLTELLNADDDTSYDASSVIAYDPNPIGTKTFVPDLVDSVMIDSTLYPAMLSICLNSSFAEEMLANAPNFNSNESFMNSFYGLRVEVEPVNGFGSMLYFSPISSETKMAMYYTNSDTSSSFNFVINENCTWFNNYYQEYSNPDLQFEFGNHQDSVSAKERLYLQPFIGTRVQLEFKGLETLRNKENIALHEVKLVLFNDADYDATIPPPNRLIIYAEDEDGELSYIADLSTAAYFDGYFNKTTNQYSMRITRYIQQRLINPIMDNDVIYLQMIGGAYQANRVVLKGNNFASLRIYYSEY